MNINYCVYIWRISRHYKITNKTKKRGGMKNKTKKAKLINFRVSEETYSKLNILSKVTKSKSKNEWFTKMVNDNFDIIYTKYLEQKNKETK